MTFFLNKIVIAGVGLIGGSFALALKQAGKVCHVVGMGRTRASLDEAHQLGIIDEVATDWATALKGADLLLLAMPVGQMDAVMAAAAPYLEPQTVVTDAGSTKRDVVEAIYRHLGAHLSQVVPSHPIAGTEKSGPSAAFAELYHHRKAVVTPLLESSAQAVETVSQAWAACGAEIFQMTPQEHDRVFAAVSHLPHLLAFGLVHELTQREDADVFFRYAASGFRDFTRIAGSHPEMWRDICSANRHALLQELDAYRAELDRMRFLLVNNDAAGLEESFGIASVARNSWAASLANKQAAAQSAVPGAKGPLTPKELIGQWVQAFNRADVAALTAFYAEDAVNHQVAQEPVVGREAIGAMFEREFVNAAMHCIIENIFEDGEWAMLEWRDPLGLRGCGFFQVQHGKIVFQRGYWDKLSFLRSQNLPIPKE